MVAEKRTHPSSRTTSPNGTTCLLYSGPRSANETRAYKASRKDENQTRNRGLWRRHSRLATRDHYKVARAKRRAAPLHETSDHTFDKSEFGLLECSSNKTTKPSATRVKNNNNPNTSNLSRKLLS